MNVDAIISKPNLKASKDRLNCGKNKNSKLQKQVRIAFVLFISTIYSFLARRGKNTEKYILQNLRNHEQHYGQCNLAFYYQG